MNPWPKLIDNKSTPGRTRTCDPLLRRQMLYPLSYGRVDMEMSQRLFQRCSLASGTRKGKSTPQRMFSIIHTIPTFIQKPELALDERA